MVLSPKVPGSAYPPRLAMPMLIVVAAIILTSEFPLRLLVAHPLTYMMNDEHLDPDDLQALKDIKSKLFDLPGSTFFETWRFGTTSRDDQVVVDVVYPCTSFMGLVCDYDPTDPDPVANLFRPARLRVRELNLGSNIADAPGLRGEIHESIGRLTSLRQFTVSPGQVGGVIPHSIGRLEKLEFLGISRNRLSGAIPPTLASGLVSLRTLDLSFNNLIGSIPPDLLRLPSLQVLLLSHNRLIGPPFPAANDRISPFLSHIDLQSNRLSGSFPPAFSFPPSLSYLSLASNSIRGELPASLFSASAPSSSSSLYFIDLSYNNLSGPIPVEPLLSLPLHSLLLHHNRFSGPLSPTSLVFIGTLDLSFNELSGHLSPLLSTVANLYLGNNMFEGDVPQEFIDELLTGGLSNLFLPHNFVTDFRLAPDTTLPDTASLCIDFNCMETPAQSHCPAELYRGTGAASPGKMNQCINNRVP